jgi:hypothetical protein
LREKKIKTTGNKTRRFVSLFGEIEVHRRQYYISGEGNYHPLDEYLNFPGKKLSYSIQNLIGQSSTEEDFRESVKVLNELLPLNLQGSQTKRIVEDLAPFVDKYYEQRVGLTKEEEESEGSILAFGNDGKGVPIVNREREETDNGDKARLMKGKKRGVKKQATVAVSFSFDPRIRDSEDVLRGLFREPTPEGMEEKDEKDRRFSKNVHKRAFMCNQKKGIDYAIEDLTRRDPEKTKPVIALVDCGPGLEEGILESIKSHGLEDNLDAVIADVVHVSEYIWKAANAILGEKFKGRTEWVRAVMKDLLESKTEKVIKDLKANVERTDLTDSKKEQVEKTIKYLTNHGHKMDYKTYLAKGYPISTGLIEGACGHLIKDRMEHSGMRWTIQGAQNIIDLRAVKKNEDWKEFMTFVKNENNPQRLQFRV